MTPKQIAQLASDDASNCVQWVMSQGAIKREYKAPYASLWNRGDSGSLEWRAAIRLNGLLGEWSYVSPWYPSIREAADDLEKYLTEHTLMAEVISRMMEKV